MPTQNCGSDHLILKESRLDSNFLEMFTKDEDYLHCFGCYFHFRGQTGD